MEIDENDIYKSEGRIFFKIEKFSEFVRAPVETRRMSDVIFVRGLPWRILVINRRSNRRARHLSYFLQCNANNPDPGWSCAADAKLKVLAQKEGKEDYMRSITHVYNDNANDWGFAAYLFFEQLMDSENGLYDEQSDTIILVADIATHAQKNMELLTFTNAKPNETIKVNNEDVAVNKFVLTLSSTYFDRYFFDDRYPKPENIELNPTTTVEDFKRMLATLPPEQRELDDGCIEAVLILADRFAMDNVVAMCRNFLLHGSNRSKLFKFRIAHKYGWNEMDEILQSMTLDDFKAENFTKNAKEFGLLDDDAEAALTSRHAQLVTDSRN